jgi:hypothetical protein
MGELALSRRPTRQVLKGIGVALIASYLYGFFVLLVAMLMDGVAHFTKGSAFVAKEWAELLLVLPFGAMTATLWFVVPVGIILGIRLPSRAYALAPMNAAIRGSAWGVLLGCVGGLVIPLVFFFASGGDFRSLLPSLGSRLNLIALLVTTMSAYSAAWVGAFAYSYARTAQRESEPKDATSVPQIS